MRISDWSSDVCSSDLNSLWVIVTPVFKPAPGGVAIYADILARALAGAGADVVVFAERHPGTSAEEALVTRRGSARVCRILPFRAGRADRNWRSYLAYAAANLVYLRLPGLIRRERRRVKARTIVRPSLRARGVQNVWVLGVAVPLK